MDNSIRDSVITFQSSQGFELRASLMSVSRYQIAFELYHPSEVLRLSEVLSEFRIVMNDRPIYSGRAVISNLIHGGITTVCDAALEEGSWMDVEFNPAANGKLRSDFAGFIAEWQKLYRILPEYKGVIADFQTFLTDLRLWLEQLELGIRSSPSSERVPLEHHALDQLAPPIIASIDAFIDRFETIAEGLEPALRPIHRQYLRRQLHPLLMSSPSAHRAFCKPLGYAGDYEMVDMMDRSPYEGGSLFAKVINVWLLGQAPVQAHRNRISYLDQKLLEVSARAQLQQRSFRVFSLGCGPAVEVQRFLRQPASERAAFTLLDFNTETLQHLGAALEEIKREFGRTTSIELVRKSVHQLLKEAGRDIQQAPEKQYDLIVCAGLFDYLSDQVCKRLLDLCYGFLAPGGLLLVTNVTDAMNAHRPFRHSLEYILDWFLIYRDGPQLAALAPNKAPPGSIAVFSEQSGVNLMMEVIKPVHV